ncbi:arginine--tRNA ligase [Mycoplasma nasistruthionis]|uniref:Arginine--tRNA ligase n=1 Tax=Mycoplasma nasistruthionis TaxID=353852 RepID=A0A4Y6I652_9MOLU|nr:arginine--tRNA ligase [Mycoplasma nasistruthionis]QDF64787.1 arginine--tRNA ligase [Mycoplasma nasistruthionis]
MTLKNIVKNTIKNAVKSLIEENYFDNQFDLNSLDFALTEAKVPDDLNQDNVVYHFSTNLAFILKQFKKTAPEIIANQLATTMLENKIFQQVDVAKPGFINIVLNNSVFLETMLNIYQAKNSFGANVFDSKEKINVEYVSANPTGFLHVGHARGAAFGDSLVRILRYAGLNVDSEYYVNDAGNQINVLKDSIYVRYLELFGINQPMPEDCYRGSDIIWAAQQIKDKYGDFFLEKTPQKQAELKNVASAILLDKIKSDLAEFNVNIDIYSSEKKLSENNLINPVIQDLKTHTYTQDGALFLKTTDYGDDKDRVLVKSDGSFTYLTPDIAYHKSKFSRADKLINIWGADHSGYIARMKIAMQCLGFNPDKLDILTIQLVRLIKDGEEFKMSKRAGTCVTLADLLEVSSADAVRFMMLTREINNKFDFDIDLANSHDANNPVFIVQYAHSRAVSLIQKLKPATFSDQLELSEKAKRLILVLDNFAELIKTIVSTTKVNLLTQYLIDLAKAFNSFYAEQKLLNHPHEATYSILINAVANVLKTGLNLIGVSAPDKM